MSKDEPVFVVKLTGILRPEDIELYERRFKEQLPGHVIMTDNRVENIYRVDDVTGPRDAMVTVRSSHEEFTPTHRHVVEVTDVHARVLPVAMGESTLLVEWDDGTLGTANLHDIRMVR